MNNTIIRHHYDTFLRIKGFGAKYADRFAAASRARTLFDDNSAVVAKMEDDGVRKISGTADYHGGTNAKQFAAELVRADLKAIRDTAVAIAEAEDTPDFDDEFRLPRSGSYAVLLTRAKAFLADAAPHKELFLEFEMPGDFLEDLDDDIKLLEKAEADQNAGLSGQVGGTAELEAEVARGLKIRKQLGAVVKNKFKNDPGIRAEWESAKHIVRPERKSREETPAG